MFLHEMSRWQAITGGYSGVVASVPDALSVPARRKMPLGPRTVRGKHRLLQQRGLVLWRETSC